VSAAYNRAFGELESDYVATCPADDLWEPRKLEYQREVLASRPEVDVAFGGARYFGLEDRDFHSPSVSGPLDSEQFFREMYVEDRIAAPSAVVRRELLEQVGGYREDLPGEDYEFWLRALANGATFYYDSRLLVRLRQHGGNLSSQALSIWELNHWIHTHYAPELGDDELARATLARDLRMIGRCRLGLGQLAEARAAYRAALAERRGLGTLAWLALVHLPGTGRALVWAAARRRAASP
jgi:hypothetical protein